MISKAHILKQIQNQSNTKMVARKAAVLIPIVTIDGRTEILFQVRSSKLNWQPGDICFPGGHVEQSDASPTETAKRELHEEIGIPIEQIQIYGHLPAFIASIGYKMYPVIGEIKSLANMQLNLDEVEKVFTVPIDWLLDNPPLEATMQVAHKPANDFPFILLPNYSPDWQKRTEHKVYFYHYQDYVIWGLTAQILRSFLDIIR